MSARLAVPKGDALVAVATHVVGLQEAGGSVIFVTTNEPADRMAAVFAEHGVDLDRLYIVDAITPAGAGQSTARCTYVGSPNLLEMVGLRVQKAARMMPDAHVIVCCLNTLTLYNDQAAVDQFTHFLATQLEAQGVNVDFILRPGAESEAMEKRARPFLPETIQLAKA